MCFWCLCIYWDVFSIKYASNFAILAFMFSPLLLRFVLNESFSLVNKLEADLMEKTSQYEKDQILWEGKIKFVEQQRDTLKKEEKDKGSYP